MTVEVFADWFVQIGFVVLFCIIALWALSGCTYRDGGWVSIAHDPQNDPYYWGQISHVVGEKMK